MASYEALATYREMSSHEAAGESRQGEECTMQGGIAGQSEQVVFGSFQGGITGQSGQGEVDTSQVGQSEQGEMGTFQGAITGQLGGGEDCTMQGGIIGPGENCTMQVNVTGDCTMQGGITGQGENCNLQVAITGQDYPMQGAIIVSETEKECKDCKLVKPASEFSVNKKNNRLLTYCKSCLSKRQKEYRRLAQEEKIQREKYLLEAAKEAERKRQLALAARLAAAPPAGHKMCKDCGQDKPAAEFNRNVKSTTGLSTYCKPCSRARVKASLARSAEQNPTASKSAPKTRICVTCQKRRPLADFVSGRKKVIPGICNLCAALPKKRQRKIQVPPGAPATPGASAQILAPGQQITTDPAAVTANSGMENGGVTAGRDGDMGQASWFGGAASVGDDKVGMENFSRIATSASAIPKPEMPNQIGVGVYVAGVM